MNSTVCTPRFLGAIGFVGVVSGAAALRWLALDRWGLWVDEAASAAFAALPWNDLLGSAVALETTPPTYYGIIKIWAAVVGSSDRALRVFSAVSGVGAVVALWLLSARAFGRRAAYWASLILAVCGWHLMHAREARVYALLTLIVLLAMLAARSFASRAHATSVGWIAPATVLAILGAFASWLHFTGVVGAMMAFAYAAVLIHEQAPPRRVHVGSGRSAALRLFFAAAACGALMLPVLHLAWQIATGSDGGVSWMRQIGLRGSVFSLFQVLLLAPATLEPWPRLGPGSAATAAAICFGLGWAALRPRPVGTELRAVMATLIVGILCFVAMNMVSPVILPRTLSLLVPVVAMLLGLGLSTLPHASLRAGIFLLFLSSQTLSINDLFRVPPEATDWRDMAGRLAEEALPGDITVVFDAFEAVAFERYRMPDAPGVDFVLLPQGQARLQLYATQRLTAAQPLLADEIVNLICIRGNGRGRVLVIERRSPILVSQKIRLDSALRAAGATQLSVQSSRNLALRVWSFPSCALHSAPDAQLYSRSPRWA